MRYKLFGRSGLRVSELCLGTMTFGGGVGSLGASGGRGSDAAESRAIFDSYAEAGGNFIDSAAGYNAGRSEELVGDCIAGDRDHFVVATKFGHNAKGGISRSGNGRKWMMASVEQSLRRLKTDRIDLLWLHSWDYTTPVDELMRGLDDLTSAGKILYAGASNMPAWEISRANMLADLRGWAPFIGIQVPYNILEREAEHEMLPMATALDLGIAAWSPLAGGLLSGRYRQVGEKTGRGHVLDPHESTVIAALKRLAAAAGCDPAAAAIALIRQERRFGDIIPIIAAVDAGQLRTTLSSTGITLPASELAELNRLTARPPTYPESMLRSTLVRGLATGGAGDLLYNHRDRPLRAGRRR